MSDGAFTHLDEHGNAHMVNVNGKDVTVRRARAACRVTMRPETAALLDPGSPMARDVLETARVAGIQAAKLTWDLLPLCHPLLLQGVDVSFLVGDDHVAIGVDVVSQDRTGVEMEALTAGAVVALTIVDMCRSLDPDLRIDDLCVWEKSGGRSGPWGRALDDHGPSGGDGGHPAGSPAPGSRGS